MDSGATVENAYRKDYNVKIVVFTVKILLFFSKTLDFSFPNEYNSENSCKQLNITWAMALREYFFMEIIKIPLGASLISNKSKIKKGGM